MRIVLRIHEVTKKREVRYKGTRVKPSTRSIVLEMLVRISTSMSVQTHLSRIYPSKKRGRPKGEGLSVNEREQSQTNGRDDREVLRLLQQV